MTLEELKNRLPNEPTCDLVEAELRIPGADREVERIIIAGIDHPYAASSDLRAEVAAWADGPEHVELAAKARARGGVVTYRIRARDNPLDRELAALRRLQRQTLYGS